VAESYRKEFAELTALAENQLEPHETDLPHHSVLFRLWRYPSFQPYLSWLVYMPRLPYQKTEAPFVLEISWNRPLDSARFTDPMKGIAMGLSVAPTVNRRQAELLQAALDLRLESLQKIRLPVVIDGSVGLDGEIFGLETFGFMTSIRLEWWSETSDEWTPLVSWAKEVREFLLACLEG